MSKNLRSVKANAIIAALPPAAKYSYNKESIAVATNPRSMIFVTIVSCVRWCVCTCVFDPIHSGASLRLSVYV